MKWRDRLALWCLRVLTPKGVCSDNVPLEVSFGPGQSSPDRPALVMTVSLHGTKQTIIAMVWNPDTAVETWAEGVAFIREWAEARR